MNDYFTRKADMLLRARELPEDGFRRVIIATLEQVAKDQREACVEAYYNIPDDAEWDVDMVIQDAEIK